MWVLVFTAVIIYLIYRGFSKPANFPPGLPRVPFLGSMPFLDLNKQPLFYRALQESGEKWGCSNGIMGYYVGNIPAVAVWNPKLVREALQRDEFQGRPDAYIFKMRSFGKLLGVFFADGPAWVEQRRFTIRQLRDLGLLGLQKVQHHVQAEITALLQSIRSLPEGTVKGSRLIEANGVFTIHIVNVLWALMSGKHCSIDDTDLRNLFNFLTRTFRGGQRSSALLNALPWVRFILPNYSQYNEINETWTSLQQFIKKTLDEHKANFNKENINDFIDAYLLEMETKDSSHESSYFCEEQLITICMDLFAAGSESVGNTLSFALLYLGLYPDVQARLWEEMKRELGVGCCPCLEDRPRLPYLEAVLQEVMRINTIAPTAVPHRVTQDTTFAGFNIPKNTWLDLSLWSISHDPAKWENPDDFRPERFIDENGKLIRDDISLNFGFGKRVCVGMSFAKNCLFLFFGAMLANFEFRFVPGEPLPSTTSLPGFTTSPQPFNILAIERK
ncbi:methyl farnesoate epoxidase-like [Ischnura elegans]|uniref:methyl farnesoate epoxidase-like n=1 Tax=Ischnura elegans TaxID=197161 RepID=UPI001ED88FB3|nr:methyl farnesoate epoxidase-like [Ischnura elegans]XP_046401398.1 methyl farnesoate epoxidase-like [Ischnura elegans]XP_046401399.1 methyl farnesoate epoxidase-like [Ischnura elegans]